jgi:hypothetical protein
MASDKLIRSSGGVVRWLVALCRDACMQAQLAHADVITEGLAEQAIERNSQAFQMGLSTEKWDELKKVHDRKMPSENDLSRTLVQEQYVLAYLNAKVWYDVHPLLWSELAPAKGAMG